MYRPISSVRKAMILREARERLGRFNWSKPLGGHKMRVLEPKTKMGKRRRAQIQRAVRKVVAKRR